MTVALTGSQSWGVRIGHIGGLVNNLLGILQATAPDTTAHWGSSGPLISALQTNITNIYADFTSLDTQLVAGSQGIVALRDAIRQSLRGQLSQFQQLCQDLTRAMVDRDVILTAGQTYIDAFRELIRQARAASNIAKPTVTIVPGTGARLDGLTVVGNPVLVGDVRGPDGLQCDHVYAETLNVFCSADSYTGSQTAYQEQYTAQGDAAQSDTLAWDWPLGSGAAASLPAVDAAAAATGGLQLLTNGSFDTFTVANTPDNWTIQAGAAGTNIFSEPTDIYRSGGKALKITGDAGLTLTSLYQTVTLLPSTVYFLNAFVHVDAAAPAAGVLEFSIVDQTLTTAIQDDQAVDQKYSVLLTLSTLQTTYVATGAMTTTQLNGGALAGGAGGIAFRTPSRLPTSTSVRIRLSTAITSAKSVFIDHVALTPAVLLYGTPIGGGPYAAVFSGSTKGLTGDAYTFAAANNYGSKFQKFLWRTGLSGPSTGLQFPSSGSGTIGDGLMV